VFEVVLERHRWCGQPDWDLPGASTGLRSGNTQASLRRDFDGEHTLQLSPGTAGDASEEGEEQGWLRHVSDNRNWTWILTPGPSHRMTAVARDPAPVARGMRSTDEAHRTIALVAHDLQCCGEAEGARGAS